MKKKKVVVIVIIILLVLLGIGAAVIMLNGKKSKDSDEMVYVESVANITGLGLTGDNRYMGIVESQETKGVEKASDKTVKEIFVEVGDEVKTGDKLFEYDTEEMTLKLRQLELELSSINTSITTANQQIASLAAERDQVEADYKMEYTAQIQSLQAQVNQYNYDASAKQLEIDRQKAAIENSVVFAPMDGIVKEINTDTNATDSESYGMYGSDNEQKSFISIMAVGDYRIKGTASELNVRSMSEGQPVIIRSRIDENVTWTGTITSIDLEHPVENNNNGYYYMDSSGTSTTNYPFYITLDSVDNLMLGQHVYVEMDYGQGAAKDGLWLDEFYIIQEENGAYVWAEDSKGRIEKRRVELGEYDENMYRYEIVSGLSSDDYIAWPEDRIKEGMKATHNYEDVLQYENIEDGGSDGDVMYDENGNVIGGDVFTDEDGNVISDELYLDEDGNVIGDDNAVYDENGNVISDDVYLDEDGNIINEDASVDGMDADVDSVDGAGEEAVE